MAKLDPQAFAARLRGIAEGMRGTARFASEGVLEGMAEIASKAVGRLAERTPRSEEDHDHIADGWTVVEGDAAAGRFELRVVNTNPRALAPIALKGGGETTLLAILEYGSRPHEIVPVNAPALAFPGANGETVFATHVNHPGTQPYAMIAITRDEVSVDLKRLIDATRTAMKRSARAQGGTA